MSGRAQETSLNKAIVRPRMAMPKSSNPFHNQTSVDQLTGKLAKLPTSSMPSSGKLSRQRQIKTMTVSELSAELQQLADSFQELKLIRIISGQVQIFIPQEVAVKQSKLLSDLVEDLTGQFGDFGHITDLPISDAYAEVLLDYTVYLNYHDRLGSSISTTLLNFGKEQKSIIKRYIATTAIKTEPYTQLSFASYLEDFHYFNHVMRKMYDI